MVFLLKDEKIIADKLDCLRLRNAAQRTRCNEFYFLLVFYALTPKRAISYVLKVIYFLHILLLIFCYFVIFC